MTERCKYDKVINNTTVQYMNIKESFNADSFRIRKLKLFKKWNKNAWSDSALEECNVDLKFHM